MSRVATELVMQAALSTAPDAAYYNPPMHPWPPMNRAERRKRAKADARVMKGLGKKKR